MERLKLQKPRQTTLALLPLSPAIPLGVHWWHRSWICGSEDENCMLCELVRRRPVVYFAGLYLARGMEEPVLGLFERGSTWYHEACRQSGTNWSEVLGRLRITEDVDGRERTVSSTSLYEHPRYKVPISIEQLSWSIAALYQFSQFPSCDTVSQAQRALQAFSARQQRLMVPVA